MPMMPIIVIAFFIVMVHAGPSATNSGAAAMTRRGAHRGGYHWGGGGVDIGQRRFDEIMGRLFAGHDELKKIESRLSDWRFSPDYTAMRAALKALSRIHRVALSTAPKATEFQLIRAGHLSRRLGEKAIRAKSRLRSMLKNAPPPEPAAPKPELPLGRLSQREMSCRPLPPDPPRFRNSKSKRNSRAGKAACTRRR